MANAMTTRIIFGAKVFILISMFELMDLLLALAMFSVNDNFALMSSNTERSKHYFSRSRRGDLSAVAFGGEKAMISSPSLFDHAARDPNA
jgi:hypothetical protein